MLIRVGCEIEFTVPAATPMILMLSVHPLRAPMIRQSEQFQVTPSVPLQQYIDQNGNRCHRVLVAAGKAKFSNKAVVEDCGLPDLQVPDAPQIAVQDLPQETVPFLLGSRYCEVDSELNSFAWSQFSSIAGGWQKVQAVCNFVHRHIRFDYQLACSTRTALGAYQQRVGVCRDFTHLAITLCRCLNIPARYCTGYLGDIGVPAMPSPMDFSAWFEAYVGGQWYTFDARHNQPRIGRVLMARGRDAADVAMTTIFGANQLQYMKVWTDEIPSTQLLAS